jgi:hypothetical protein
MIVGARKYDAFRCPECGTALMIIEAARGLTMVSQAPAAHGRVRQATRGETVETETALPAVES